MIAAVSTESPSSAAAYERPSDLLAKAICFYLPQYHQTPENDLWWGGGFTDWVNVSRATPRFDGHYQPHVPGELGTYDLRLISSQTRQAELAAQFGIYGFCYYHYWFKGKRLLGEPLDNMLASGTPDFPFCLCWANETWSRTWSGLDHEVLIRQEYDAEDHDSHIAWLFKVFTDSRYIRVGGRPLFAIYRPENIPNIARVIEQWSDQCIESIGTAPFFCAVRTGFSVGDEKSYRHYGFDATIDFQPNRNSFPAASNRVGRVLSAGRNVLPGFIYDRLRTTPLLKSKNVNTILSYNDYVEKWISNPYEECQLIFPCVFPSWDNSARRTAATIIQNESPAAYGRWLKAAVDRASKYPPESRFLFINAWNEWAEGCHLEPDIRHGRDFLRETLSQLSGPCT